MDGEVEEEDVGFFLCLSIEFFWCVWRKVFEWGEGMGFRIYRGMVG